MRVFVFCAPARKKQTEYSKKNHEVGKINGRSAEQDDVIDREAVNHSVVEVSERADDDNARRNCDIWMRSIRRVNHVEQHGADNDGNEDDEMDFKRNVERDSPIFVNGEVDDARNRRGPFFW